MLWFFFFFCSGTSLLGLHWQRTINGETGTTEIVSQTSRGWSSEHRSECLKINFAWILCSWLIGDCFLTWNHRGFPSDNDSTKHFLLQGYGACCLKILPKASFLSYPCETICKENHIENYLEAKTHHMDFRESVQFRTLPAWNFCISKELGHDAEKDHFQHFSLNTLSNDPWDIWLFPIYKSTSTFMCSSSGS